MKKFYILSFLFACSMMAQALEYITVGGVQRSMIVYAPKNLPTSPALVISMHGASPDYKGIIIKNGKKYLQK